MPTRVAPSVDRRRERPAMRILLLLMLVCAAFGAHQMWQKRQGRARGGIRRDQLRRGDDAQWHAAQYGLGAHAPELPVAGSQTRRSPDSGSRQRGHSGGPRMRLRFQRGGSHPRTDAGHPSGLGRLQARSTDSARQRDGDFGPERGADDCGVSREWGKAVMAPPEVNLALRFPCPVGWTAYDHCRRPSSIRWSWRQENVGNP